MLALYGVLYIKEYYLRQCNRFNWWIHKIFELRNEGGLSEAVKHRENGHDLWHDLYNPIILIGLVPECMLLSRIESPDAN